MPAVAGGVAVLVLLLGLQTCRLDAAQGKVVELEQSVKAAKEANAQNQSEIDRLTKLQQECVAGREAEKLANAEELRRLTAEKAVIQQALDAAKRDREANYDADPDCRAWADAPMCPVADHSLRARAAGSH